MEFSCTISARESEDCFLSYSKAKDKFKMAVRKDIGQVQVWKIDLRLEPVLDVSASV